MSSRVTRAIAILAVAIAAACQDDLAVPQPCTNIPAGGCPINGSQECTDPTCEAVYACKADRTWSLERVCPVHDAGLVDAAPVEAAALSSVRDASTDVAGSSGGPGCPNLQPPDCSLGAGLACPPTMCCGCEDLFVCTAGSWNAWGTCNKGTITPR